LSPKRFSSGGKEVNKLQEQNNFCTAALDSFGYKGSCLAVTVNEKKVSVEAKLTSPNSQERVEALAKTKTHGDRFLCTGGAHLNSDEAFMAAEMSIRKRKLEEVQSDRKKRKQLEKRETEAQAVLNKNTVNGTDAGKLLTWYGVNHTGLNATQKKAKWKEIADENRPDPTFEKWTHQDEAAMKELESTDFSLQDTILERTKMASQNEFEANLKSMPTEEAIALFEGLKSMAQHQSEL